ncbi:MAG: hypothetical protein ABI551_18775 [Polyangiaceae bacterium]
MTLIAFTKNHEDLSTDKGYQFKFFCDKCGNGYMTTFDTSFIGTAGAFLRAAGDIFGGHLSGAGYGAYEVQRAVGGPQHDTAFTKAVEECKQHFCQCRGCGLWVCPEVCWNPQAGQCKGCAPDFQQELVSAHAQAKADAARSQLQEAAQKEDYVSGIDMSANAVYHAPPPQQMQQASGSRPLRRNTGLRSPAPCNRTIPIARPRSRNRARRKDNRGRHRVMVRLAMARRAMARRAPGKGPTGNPRHRATRNRRKVRPSRACRRPPRLRRRSRARSARRRPAA